METGLVFICFPRHLNWFGLAACDPRIENSTDKPLGTLTAIVLGVELVGQQFFCVEEYEFFLSGIRVELISLFPEGLGRQRIELK